MKLKIETGKRKRAQRIVVYAPEGFGKSTLGSKFPAPLVIDTERGGTDHLDVARVRADTYEQLKEAVEFLANEKHDFASVVVDTADWAEKSIAEWICARDGKASIEDYGYGKGYIALADEFGKFLLSLDSLLAKGINVLVLAHSHVKTFTPPDAASGYERWELKMTKQCAPLLKEWADALLFANKTVKLQDREGGKARGVDGERVFFTEHTAAWDAKNRADLDDELPFRVKSLLPLLIVPSKKEKPETKETDAASEDAGPSPQERVRAVLNDKLEGEKEAAQVIQFLIAREVIKQGGGVLDLPASYASRILKDPDKFLTTVKESLEEKEVAK